VVVDSSYIFAIFCGMDSTTIGRQIIRRAETELRRVLADAASRGEYDSVPVLTSWAKHLNALAAAEPGTQVATTPEAKAPARSPVPSVPVSAEAPKKKASGGRRKKKATRQARRASGGKPGYPKFVREEDRLVKIGWSKGKKATYEHKVERRSLETVVARIARVAEHKRKFVVDDLGDFESCRGESEVPVYQVYLCIAWLRTSGLIEQHGRAGYSVGNREDFAQAVEEAWKRLDVR
jgi:hypothetical protein